MDESTGNLKQLFNFQTSNNNFQYNPRTGLVLIFNFNEDTGYEFVYIDLNGKIVKHSSLPSHLSSCTVWWKKEKTVYYGIPLHSSASNTITGTKLYDPVFSRQRSIEV